MDPNFAPFLAKGASWAKKTKAQPLRGFTDDNDSIPEAKRQVAEQMEAYWIFFPPHVLMLSTL